MSRLISEIAEGVNITGACMVVFIVFKLLSAKITIYEKRTRIRHKGQGTRHKEDTRCKAQARPKGQGTRKVKVHGTRGANWSSSFE
jgi:hypothetical protein